MNLQHRSCKKLKSQRRALLYSSGSSNLYPEDRRSIKTRIVGILLILAVQNPPLWVAQIWERVWTQTTYCVFSWLVKYVLLKIRFQRLSVTYMSMGIKLCTYLLHGAESFLRS